MPPGYLNTPMPNTPMPKNIEREAYPPNNNAGPPVPVYYDSQPPYDYYQGNGVPSLSSAIPPAPVESYDNRYPSWRDTS